MRARTLLCLSMLLAIAWPHAASSADVPVVGSQLIPIALKVPAATDKQAYLGLSATRETFDPIDIAGQLLVIEIFSMYCPYCQREAPAVNRLYQAIEASDRLRGRVKLIGIGVGNSDFEVEHFRSHYQIAFPLFPDDTFVIHRALGQVRTPFFIFVAIGSPDRGKILWTGAGKLDPLERVIDRLTTLTEQR